MLGFYDMNSLIVFNCVNSLRFSGLDMFVFVCIGFVELSMT